MKSEDRSGWEASGHCARCHRHLCSQGQPFGLTRSVRAVCKAPAQGTFPRGKSAVGIGGGGGMTESCHEKSTAGGAGGVTLSGGCWDPQRQLGP